MSTALVPEADKKAFAQCFNRLAKAKRAKDIDAADLQIYFDKLQQFPQWAIDEAASELQQKHTFGFPTLDVWYQQCEAEIARRLRENLIHGREWKEECGQCRDSGWKEATCTHKHRCGRRFCDQLGEKHEHTFYSACVCRATNRTYQRNTQASQLGHANPEQK